MSHVSQEYVGRYRLLNQLRFGKTCQVWEVMNDVNGQRMAIKLLLSNFRNDRQEVSLRFQHFSNAGIKEPNPGENFFQVRYSSRY